MSKTKEVIKNLALSIVVTMVVGTSYVMFEPIVITAATDTDDVIVTQEVTSGISISDGSNITMPAISVSQNAAVGSSSWNVITNHYNGYTLTVQASGSPALQEGAKQFADYTTAVDGTPETWSVTGAYEFGFTVRGPHVNTTTYGTDTGCTGSVVGSPSENLKWRGFSGTTPITVATASTETGTSGESTTLCVAAEQNGVFAPSGNYTATITGTAITN